MKTEFEIKVLDVDVAATTKLLVNFGFKKHPAQNFRRYIYPITGSTNSWLRLRTNGSKTTLTVKEYDSDSIAGVKELEIVVPDFENTHKLLQKLGHKNTNYQENIRTVFVSSKYEAEISIDEWPLIPAYLEIEAKDEKTVNELLTKININNLPTTSAPTEDVYARYGLKLTNYKSLSFKK